MVCSFCLKRTLLFFLIRLMFNASQRLKLTSRPTSQVIFSKRFFSLFMGRWVSIRGLTVSKRTNHQVTNCEDAFLMKASKEKTHLLTENIHHHESDSYAATPLKNRNLSFSGRFPNSWRFGSLAQTGHCVERPPGNLSSNPRRKIGASCMRSCTGGFSSRPGIFVNKIRGCDPKAHAL